MRRIGFVTAFALCLAACAGKEGSTGPTGPAGADGLQGPTGTGTKIVVYTATANVNGLASAAFAAAVGTDPNAPPDMVCYVSGTGLGPTGTWVAISSNGSPQCSAVFSNGVWNGTVIHANTGWTAAFVVVY